MILKIAFPYEDVCFGVPAGNLSLIRTFRLMSHPLKHQ